MAKKKSKPAKQIKREGNSKEEFHVSRREEKEKSKPRLSDRISERFKDEKILYAWLAAFLSIVGFVIAIIAKKDDKYVMYYAKHSLVIFIIGCIAGAISFILGWIPIIGLIIKFALFIIVFVIWLLSWLYALEGEEKSIPIVTNWTKKFDL